MADQSIHPAMHPTQDEVRFTLDGREVVGFKGETIIRVAAREGVYIPHYCWHPSLSVAGNCRLCLVEIHMPNPRNDNKLAPLPKPAIGCQTVIAPGMHVFTASEEAKKCQNDMMEFLLVNHPLDCPVCDRGGECMLQRYSFEYGQSSARMRDKKRRFIKPQLDPLIDVERNRCIMCTRCVRFCDEVAGEHVMGVFDRGEGNYIGTFGQGPVANILSGNVIDICPVGCLTSKPFRFKARPWELLQTQSTSVWDASGAKVTHWTRNGRLYRTTPPSRKYHDAYTVNEDTEEFIDNVTRFGSDFPYHESRWDESRIRIGSTLLPAAFTEAVKQAAEGLSQVKRTHGADSIATLVSPRATMEEGYLAAKFARTVLGNDNVDWRMSFHTKEAANAAALALDHADGDLDDGFSAAILVNGDYLHTAPVFAMRVKEHARLFGKPVVLIGHHHDHFFGEVATHRFHCAPGATARAVSLLGNVVRGNEADGIELAKLLGTDEDGVKGLVETLRGCVGKALVIQSLEDMNGAFLPEEVPAAITLRDALGDAWCYMPVLRDRNAFGLRIVGAEPGRLPADEATVREAWKIADDAELPAGGIAARNLVEEIESGHIKGLLVFGADVLHTHPDRARLLAALDKLEFYVISDLFQSEYTELADVYLAAASNLERNGTMSDIEGNLARLAETEGLVGGARPDWEALTGLANMMGAENFEYESVEDVFVEMMSVIAPEFQGSFDGLMLRGPRNDLSISDPGGARQHTPAYNPGDYRVDGGHFRGNVGEVEKREYANNATDLPEDGFLLTWGEHAQADDYHLNRASIAHLLRIDAYAEVNPADASKLGIEDLFGVHTGLLTLEGNTYRLNVIVRNGPMPGTIYVPSGLGDLRFSGHSEPKHVKLVVEGAAVPVGAV